MSTEYLRDKEYRIIGSIETDSRGKQVGRDARYGRLGEYDPATDMTRDNSYRAVGTGNQLAALIRSSVKELPSPGTLWNVLVATSAGVP